jgi:2'-hydroxyisoflavone reductase
MELMRLLILGGTVFLGRHVADQAIKRGWEVTLFNRGQTNPDLFPQAKHLVGDRIAGDLSSLEGGEWDACIDTCGYVPRVVRQSCEVLRPKVGHYNFVSTISVYSDMSTANQDESAPVGVLGDETTEEITGESYGPLKVLCERAVREVWGNQCAITRPGLIIGPDDKSDRFTYWPVRIASGGEVAVPDAAEQPAQAIDVRDLAAFMLDLTERKETGTYNATGPQTPWTFQQIWDACLEATGSGATLIPIPMDLLEKHEVAPWSGLPLWLPADGQGMSQISVDKAIAAGMSLRPLLDTVRDTLAWWNGLEPKRDLRAGISRQKEEELLADCRESCL